MQRRVEDARLPEFADYTSVRIIAAICILAVAAYLFLALFQPGLKYKIAAPPDGSPASPEFMRMIGQLPAEGEDGNKGPAKPGTARPAVSAPARR